MQSTSSQPAKRGSVLSNGPETTTDSKQDPLVSLVSYALIVAFISGSLFVAGFSQLVRDSKQQRSS